MKLNYKSLGNFIELVDLRNKDDINPQAIDAIKGISSISKSFIKTKANLVGVKPDNYKVIKPGQFGFNPNTARMGDRIPIALNTGKNNVLVSSIYPTFKIIDSNLLLSEYLLMWFKRPEFDRYARFKSHGSAREIFDWEEMCNVELPIPSIEKQRKIVEEYNTIVNRMKLNEQLNQKLEETAEALYKHWFVDFEFPDKNGQPFKSSGGNMVYNVKLEKEIPVGWEVKELGELCYKITKGTTPKFMSELRSENTPVFYVKGESINESHHFDLSQLSYIDKTTHDKLLRSQLEVNDICYSIAGSLDKFTLVDKEVLPANTNQAIAIIRIDEKIIPYQYIYGFFISQLQKEYYNHNIQHAVQENLSLATISSLPVLIPSNSILKDISHFMDVWLQNRNLLVYQKRRLNSLIKLLLSKMSKTEAHQTSQSI